ncbi:MAG: YfjI family protein [Solirubrobacteraceae bacterium]
MSAKDWPELGAGELPAFPLAALPADVRAWVQATAAETQTPVDLAIMSALGVMSAAAIGAAHVECPWTEQLSLYLLTALPPGDRKSTVLRAAVAPLRAVEADRARIAAPQIRELRTRAEILETRRRKLTKTAGESSDPDKRKIAEAELAETDELLAEIGNPVAPRLLADDSTPEALAGLLAAHEQVAFVSAESALLDNTVSGRYGEGGPNLHLLLKAYDAEETVIDRRGREPERIERPLVTVCLVSQPHVLNGLVTHKTASDQGLVSRFAFSLPTTQLGHREIDAPKVPASIAAGWAQCVRRLASVNRDSVGFVSTSQGLRFSDAAAARFRALRAELEPRLQPTGDLRQISQWASRHPGRIARIAGLLHLAEHPATEPISGDSMAAACKIGGYMLAHALAALTGPDPLTRKALQWLTAAGKATVTVRELQRGPIGGRGTAEEASALAKALVKHGALRAAPVECKGSGRPSSPSYEVNPVLTADRNDRTTKHTTKRQPTEPTKTPRTPETADTTDRIGQIGAVERANGTLPVADRTATVADKSQNGNGHADDPLAAMTIEQLEALATPSENGAERAYARITGTSTGCKCGKEWLDDDRETFICCGTVR